MPGDAEKTQGQPHAPRTEPRTERGRRTLRALLDAAAHEFGEKGFHATGISDITRRAGVALGSFYTYFPGKEDIFRALVADLSAQVKDRVGPHLAEASDALSREQMAFDRYLDFVLDQQLIYRIIDEAEFVAPDSYQSHYRRTIGRIEERLRQGAAAGELRPGLGLVEAWAIAGMNVFLGLRFAVWPAEEGDPTLAEVRARTHQLLAAGIRRDGEAAS